MAITTNAAPDRFDDMAVSPNARLHPLRHQFLRTSLTDSCEHLTPGNAQGTNGNVLPRIVYSVRSGRIPRRCGEDLLELNSVHPTNHRCRSGLPGEQVVHRHEVIAEHTGQVVDR